MGASGGGREHECRGDLVWRERRGQLSASDRLALDAHLEACGGCRTLRQVYADFQDDSAVQDEDAARIERLAAVARRWAQRKKRPARARFFHGMSALRGLALSLVAVFVAGSTSAAAWWWRRPATEPAPVPARVVHVVTHVGPPARPVHTAPPERPAAPDPEQTPPAVTPASHVPRPHASALSAPVLLREAGEARQRGDAEHAIALYRRLQRDFRDSPEAILSSVPMGGLLLGRRLPRAALAQFDLYLGSAHGGVLIPEALYGRGRALAALGDRQEETRTWRRLLGDFPESAYTPHAKRRLVELE
jgi:hypothetical protein